MGEHERLIDDDIEHDDARGLPQPATDDELALEHDDQARADELAYMQLEHGALDLKPRLADEDDHAEAPGKTSAKSPLGAIRFADDATLASVANGTTALSKGAAGIHVIKVQRALAELGHLDGADVSGTLDDKTVAAIKKFQAHRGLTESGTLDAATMIALDGMFKNHAVEALRAASKKAPLAPKGKSYAKGSAPKELLEGTHKLTKAEKKAFADGISTEQVAGATGTLPKFKNKVGGETYEQRLEALLVKLIDRQLSWAKKDEAARSAGHVYDWGDINNVAQQSAAATDAIFGKYARGNPLQGTGPDANIKDAWETKEKQLAADPSLGDGWAEWRVEKLLTGNKAVKDLDKEHGAIQTRATEKAIVSRVRTKLATSRRDDLILIHKAWPAFASGGDVFIQRIQERDAGGKIDNAKGRDYMWKQFQTIIHEYIHTLEHEDHVKYRSRLDAQKGGFTLREGVTDYFTKVVYNNTVKTPTLRKAVEGPFHEPGVTHAVGDLTTYGESENAERAAGIVGFDNMAAAFFLGHTELIGG